MTNTQLTYEVYRDLINYKLATPPYKILEDAYGRAFDTPYEAADTWVADAYREEKLFVMKKNFLIWMNTLDTWSFRRLTLAVQAYSNRTYELTNNNNTTNEE